MFTEANERLLRLADRGPAANDHYKLIHLHIPKTAGVSFLALFKRCFEDPLHLPWNAGGPTWKKTIQGGRTPRFTTGHIRFREIFFGPIVSTKPLLIMSIVRDPLARAISDYNYMRSSRHPLNAEFYASAPDVDTYIRQRTEQRNLQAQWLCGFNNDIEAVKGAVSRHFVGLAPLDRIDPYVLQLQRAFVDREPAELERRNELQEILHGEKVSPSDVSPDVLKAFQAANDLDQMIYDQSMECWDKVFGG
ncbi:MAG: hypothetical protein AB7U46_00270 [Paenirhodobacter sp.]|uniref:hypothetical protein n=1 Tax=Paenirhodobacter sp. TaxID=1965326 RepID=UPI003D11A800